MNIKQIIKWKNPVKSLYTVCFHLWPLEEAEL